MEGYQGARKVEIEGFNDGEILDRVTCRLKKKIPTTPDDVRRQCISRINLFPAPTDDPR